nr:OprO/OprP family phosphate-selective porin [uncultured Halomonas sp.]
MLLKRWLLYASSALLLFSVHTQGFEISPQGKLHLDYATQREDRTNLDDDFQIRRARVGVKGGHGDWRFKLDYEFTDDGDFKDAYLGYEGFQAGNVTVGQFKVPFGLEQQISSDDISFIERSLATEALVLSRRTGIGFSRADKRYSASVMAFGPEIDKNNGYGAAVRATFAPLLEKNQRLLHIGVAAATEYTKGSTSLGTPPESRPGSTQLVDTDSIDGVDRIDRLGLEAAWQRGPVSAQAEWIHAGLRRDSGQPDVDVDGWYLSGSWFITGETRPYEKGMFKSVEPKRDSGAWELVTRYSDVDLNDRNIEGGSEHNLTLGVNWYISSDLRLMLDYTDVHSRRQGESDDPEILTMRAQISF